VTAGRRDDRILAATGIGGAGLLGVSLSTRPGSPQFYLLTLGLAGTWAAGALHSGPGPLSGLDHRASAAAVAGPVLTGAAAFGLFYGAARVARRIPPLSRAVGSVLRYAHRGAPPLVFLTAGTNAVAEELFFRGALWAAVPAPITTTTVAYAAAVAATRNPALVAAGAATSVLFGYQRRITGGVLAPALSHVTWSLLMLYFLPRLFPPADPPAGGNGPARQPAAGS